MKPPRTAQRLPRYTRRKWLKGSQVWAYYFEPPTWARKGLVAIQRGACPVLAEELGTDYASAVSRVEGHLLPQLDSWRTKGVSDLAPPVAPKGSLDWLFAVYRDTEQFKVLSKNTRALHEDGFEIVGQHLLSDGRRLGMVKLSSIDTAAVDTLFAKLVKIPVSDADGKQLADSDGQPIFRERRTTLNHAMKTCRRAWNVAFRRHPKIVPALNPFSKMGLKGSGRITPAATYEELSAVVAKSDELGLSSLGTAKLLTWEWLQREEHIFTAFKVEHYRPKDRPNEALIVHPKNGEDVWVPLFDKEGAPLFPELMSRMDAIKRNRIGGLMFVRDWSDKKAGVPLPWVTATGDLRYMSQKSKELIAASKIRREVTFTSFRHGGLTECGDSDLTDTQIRAVSRHKSAKVLPGYIKHSQRQIIDGTLKRRAVRNSKVD